jgi:hypothetical protein
LRLAWLLLLIGWRYHQAVNKKEEEDLIAKAMKYFGSTSAKKKTPAKSSAKHGKHGGHPLKKKRKK